jgi:hypothetical protein
MTTYLIHCVCFYFYFTLLGGGGGLGGHGCECETLVLYLVFRVGMHKQCSNPAEILGFWNPESSAMFINNLAQLGGILGFGSGGATGACVAVPGDLI